MHKANTHSGKTGFTLAEILLAMMVFAIAITTILALLARSIETADSILIKDEAIGLSSAVDSYMSELPFVEAYTLVQPGDGVLYAYQYRAEVGGTPRADGSLPAFETISEDDNLGEDYVVLAGVREFTDTILLNEDLTAQESRLFYVKLSVSPANPFTGTLPSDPNQSTGSTGFPDYDSAVLVVLAEFYPVPDTSFIPETTQGQPNYVAPVFSFNFAVRR